LFNLLTTFQLLSSVGYKAYVSPNNEAKRKLGIRNNKHESDFTLLAELVMYSTF